MSSLQPSLEETRAEIEKSLAAMRQVELGSYFPLEIRENQREAVDILKAVLKLLDAGKMSPQEADASAVKALSGYIHRMNEVTQFDDYRASVSVMAKA